MICVYELAVLDLDSERESLERKGLGTNLFNHCHFNSASKQTLSLILPHLGKIPPKVQCTESSNRQGMHKDTFISTSTYGGGEG